MQQRKRRPNSFEQGDVRRVTARGMKTFADPRRTGRPTAKSLDEPAHVHDDLLGKRGRALVHGCPGIRQIAARPACAPRSRRTRSASDQSIKLNLISAGSYEGCGCGVQLGEWSAECLDLDELLLRRESLHALAAYLREEPARLGAIELYACLDGTKKNRRCIVAFSPPLPSKLMTSSFCSGSCQR